MNGIGGKEYIGLGRNFFASHKKIVHTAAETFDNKGTEGDILFSADTGKLIKLSGPNGFDGFAGVGSGEKTVVILSVKEHESADIFQIGGTLGLSGFGKNQIKIDGAEFCTCTKSKGGEVPGLDGGEIFDGNDKFSLKLFSV